MRVDYILATHLQCKPRSDRVRDDLPEAHPSKFAAVGPQPDDDPKRDCGGKEASEEPDLTAGQSDHRLHARHRNKQDQRIGQ